MSLTGNLGVFPLEDVLRMLSHSQKSGCLRIEGSGVQGRVFLDAGKLSFATVATDDEFRRQLLAAGLVDESQFRRVELSGAVLTEVLAEDATAAGLSEFVREHVVESLYRIRKPEAGTFDFLIDKAPRYPTGQSLDVDMMLSEADRRAHEWAEIESVLPDGSAPIRMIPELPDENSVTLSPLTWRILAALGSGSSTLSIARSLGMSAFWTSSEMASLVRNGLVEPVARQAQAASDPSAAPVAAPVAAAAPVATPVADEPAVTAADTGLDGTDEPLGDQSSVETPDADDRPWELASPVEASTDQDEELSPDQPADDAEQPGDMDAPVAYGGAGPGTDDGIPDAPAAAEIPTEEIEVAHTPWPEVADDDVAAPLTVDELVPADEPVGDPFTADRTSEAEGDDIQAGFEPVADSPWSRIADPAPDEDAAASNPWQQSSWAGGTPAVDAETVDEETADEDQDASWSQWGVIEGEETAEQPVVAPVETEPAETDDAGESPEADAGSDQGWWSRATGQSEPPEPKATDAEADRFLESVFSSLSDDDEPGDDSNEDETGFGLGLLRRRRMNAAARDIADNDT